MSSIYLECNGCGAIFDRRPKNDHREGGAYRDGQYRELCADALAAGWLIRARSSVLDDEHFCQACSGGFF